jgi:hypothetical protein
MRRTLSWTALSAAAVALATLAAPAPHAQAPDRADADDGRLHTTIDDGSEWTDLTSHLPVRKRISRVVPSRFAAGGGGACSAAIW